VSAFLSGVFETLRAAVEFTALASFLLTLALVAASLA